MRTILIIFAILLLPVPSSAESYYVCCDPILVADFRSANYSCLRCSEPKKSPDVRSVNGRNACRNGYGIDFRSRAAAREFKRIFCDCKMYVRYRITGYGMLVH
jgi:hypothetical protein